MSDVETVREALDRDAWENGDDDTAWNAFNRILVDRDALKADAERYRWLKQASKVEYLWARGAFGLDDSAIDAAMEKRDE